MKILLIIGLIALILLPAGAVSAEERDGEPINIVGLFLGATTKFKERVRDETGFTIAGEYEYIPAKWDHKWGFAGAIELIDMHELEGILIPMVYYHATDNLFIRGGVGLEVGASEDEATGSAHLLVRSGIGYSIPVGNALLVPSFDFDWVRSDMSIVYGVVIAREF